MQRQGHKVALALQGGAGPIPERRYLKMQNAIEAILSELFPQLENGASALVVVERAVILLEDNELFNAGFGSTLRSDGSLQMDAAIMDGKTLSFGAVGAVSRVKNPIRLARLIMEKLGSNFLVGEGAEKFARESGLKLVSKTALICDWRRKQWERRAKMGIKSREDYDRQGTVGAVALDRYGNLASATSTGGIFFAPPFRVGDTPVIGAGTYADDICAVSATGVGETIIKAVLAKSCADLIRNGLHPVNSARLAIKILGERFAGRAGLIALDRLGRFGYAFNTERMVFASLPKSSD